jgi:histidinol-phosphate aminotransferase
MEFNIKSLLRKNIANLVPYSSARDEFSGIAAIYLDANENSLGSPYTKWYNRYPDPSQKLLKEKVASIKGIPPSQIFLGNGSDEPIDILFRAFCEPGIDNVMILPPTYGMYEVSANINNVAITAIPLTENFQPDLDAIANGIDDHTKIIWICSPNNPTGNSIDIQAIEMILLNFNGIVVVDEAYINFSRHRSWIPELIDFPNLVVLQTLSKAWGLAGLRIGMAFGSEEIIHIMNTIKSPYNISQPAQDITFNALENLDQVNDMIKILVDERELLATALASMPIVEKIFPSDANFLLVRFYNAQLVYDDLASVGIIVRNRSKIEQTKNCLRITVGTPTENKQLIKRLQEIIIP